MAYYDEDGNEVSLDELSVETTVDGQTQTQTVAQIRAAAQKAAAADKRLEEASRLRAEAEQLAKDNRNSVEGFQALKTGLRGNDPDALRKAAKALEWSDEEFDKWYAEATAQLNNGQRAPTGVLADPAMKEIREFIEGLKRRGVSPEAFIETTGTLAGERVQTLVESRLTEALKGDAMLKRHVSDPAKAQAVMELAKEKLQRRSRAGKAFGDEDYAAAVRETAAIVKALGGSQTQPGLGGAPTVDGELGYPVQKPKGGPRKLFDTSPDSEDYFHWKMLEAHKQRMGITEA